MNVAIATWSLVLGGWVLPSDSPPIDRPLGPTYQRPVVQSDIPRSGAGYQRPTSGYQRAGSDYQRPSAGSRRVMSSSGSQSPGPGAGRTGEPAQSPAPFAPSPQVTRQEPQVPFPPTDPWAVSESYPWAPPTANSPQEYGAAGRGPTAGRSATPYSGTGGSGLGPYTMPGRTRPAYQGYPSHRSQRARSRGFDPTRRAAAHSPQTRVSKPFSNYSRPRGISPWTNLYRTNNYYGTTDNYNELVRPVLEQQQANRRFGTDVSGLQSRARIQGTDIRNLGRQTQRLQGTGSREYYMNLGGYYPGFGR